MKIYRFTATQVLPAGLDTAWSFFSDPRNLQLVTPPWLNLVPTSELPAVMHPGLLVTYRVKPVPGIAVNWVTEITHVADRQFFVDEQRFGPYRFWHHQHHFREAEGGTEASDILHYALPFGPVGELAGGALVARRVRRIFAYRRAALAHRFGGSRQAGSAPLPGPSTLPKAEPA